MQILLKIIQTFWSNLAKIFNGDRVKHNFSSAKAIQNILIKDFQIRYFFAISLTCNRLTKLIKDNKIVFSIGDLLSNIFIKFVTYISGPDDNP